MFEVVIARITSDIRITLATVRFFTGTNVLSLLYVL